MLMKFLSHVLAFILATFIVTSVSSWIFNQTLWNATFIEKQAVDNQLYTKLSTAIPAMVAKSDPEAASSGLSNVDPVLIQTQFESLLPQFIGHVHNGGPAPVLDVTTISDGLGQPLPEGNDKMSLSFGDADATVVKAGQNLRTAGMLAPWAALGLIILIAVAMRSLLWSTLSRAAFDSAVGLGLLAGVLALAPQFLLQALKKPDTLALHDAVAPFGNALFNAMAASFGLAALVCLGAAIGLWFVNHAARIKARFIPKSKPKNPSGTPPIPGTIAK